MCIKCMIKGGGKEEGDIKTARKRGRNGLRVSRKRKPNHSKKCEDNPRGGSSLVSGGRHTQKMGIKVRSGKTHMEELSLLNNDNRIRYQEEVNELVENGDPNL